MESRRHWHVPELDDAAQAAVQALSAELGLSLPLVHLLWQRGHRQAAAIRTLLEPRPEHLLDPFRMADMQPAAARLRRAVQQQEHIVVNGDYDCDGVTGTALLVSELRGLGAHVDFFIPDRERDGYGITPRLVQRAGDVGVRVLVSVDIGSSDHATIEMARERGIDVVVVDHHEIPARPAAACAVLNPKRADCAYPFKGLSAVGVAYKLMQAVCRDLSPTGAPRDGLDFVALGTLADVQPVVEENRTLVALGLERLTSDPRPGIRALRDACGVLERVQSRQVGYRLVPRLNAVGRVARGKLAVDLLLAADAGAAGAFAAEMEAQNRRRQLLEQQVTEAALVQAERLWGERAPAALVLASRQWHPGVVGITAARLADRFGVPAAVIGIQNGMGRGSVRSAGDVNVKAALDATADLLPKYGGHREAAGFSIDPAQVETFAVRFEAAVRESRAAAARRSLDVDVGLDPDDLRPELATALERLEPFGTGHPEPLFLIRRVTAGARTRIVGRGHLKLDLEVPGGRRLDAIAFHAEAAFRPAEVIGRELDVVAHVRRQDPRWGDDLQLVVVDLRQHQPPAAGAPNWRGP
jgi:single-stranded-DNA-specific exonuclease